MGRIGWGQWRRGRIAGLLSVVAASLVLGGCVDQSPVDPDARVQVNGQVLDPAGRPLQSRPVRMGTGVTDADGALGVFTLGLSCTTGACTGDVWDTTTDADGRFSFEIEGRDTQSSFGEARSTLITASAAPPAGAVSGAEVSARFQVRTDRIDLPALSLVDPGVTIEPGERLRVAWTTSAPGPYGVRFEDERGMAVWAASTADPQFGLDARVLEGTSGRVVVGGGSSDAIEGSDVAVRWRSPGVGYASRLGPPPSRGHSCQMVRTDGLVDPADEAGCAVTDGDLVAAGLVLGPCAAEGDDASICPPPAAVQIDLGAPVAVDLVVVRGCVGGCAVELSADASTWTSAGAAADGHGVVTASGAPVRWVRVGLGTDPLTGLQEVSVWEPVTAEADLSLAPESGGDALRDAFDIGGDGAGRGRSRWWPALAGIFAAVMLVSVGIAIGRRR